MQNGHLWKSTFGVKALYISAIFCNEWHLNRVAPTVHLQSYLNPRHFANRQLHRIRRAKSHHFLTDMSSSLTRRALSYARLLSAAEYPQEVIALPAIREKARVLNRFDSERDGNSVSLFRESFCKRWLQNCGKCPANSIFTTTRLHLQGSPLSVEARPTRQNPFEIPWSSQAICFA